MRYGRDYRRAMRQRREARALLLWDAFHTLASGVAFVAFALLVYAICLLLA